MDIIIEQKFSNKIKELENRIKELESKYENLDYEMDLISPIIKEQIVKRKRIE